MALRQKLRKYIKDFEEDMAKFRENPDLPDEDEEKGNTLWKNFFSYRFSCIRYD